MYENVLNRNAKHTESKKTFQNGPKSFLSRTKLPESVGNAKQSIFYFRPRPFTPDSYINPFLLPNSILCFLISVHKQN